MTDQTPPAYKSNSAFVPGTKMQFAFDSVSLGALKTCPRFYELAIVEGWEPRVRSVHLTFGILLHSARERYYHAKAQGANHDTALKEGLSWLLQATYDCDLRRPISLEGESTKTRLTLVRSFVWYCDHWRDDPLETVQLDNGKPAVELSFRFETSYEVTARGYNDPHSDDDPLSAGKYTITQPVVLCGHLDRLARFNGKLYVSDLKTTKHTLDQSYFLQFSPDNQMSLYSLAGQMVLSEPIEGIVLDAVQVAVTFSRFSRGIVPRSADQLDEFYTSLGAYIAQAQAYAEADFWPMNDKACFRCQFRNICAKPAATRTEWLRADFRRRMWDPLSTRGDI